MEPFRVVCIKKFKNRSIHGRLPYLNYPKVGEIYTVFDTRTILGITGYSLCELHPNDYFNIANFREVDDTFGEAVCEIIEQQIEYEKVLI